jgi:hypothetical protein
LLISFLIRGHWLAVVDTGMFRRLAIANPSNDIRHDLLVRLGDPGRHQAVWLRFR